MKSLKGLCGSVVVLSFVAVGCAKGPAPPFDTMKHANVTAFRLQNYEPPAAAQPAAGAPAPVGGVPGLPPQIGQWLQQGAAGLEQLIPPGLVPPGLIPGLGGPAAGAAAPPPPAPDAPRFHTFRILSQTPVVDERLKEELAEVMGDEDNFNNKHSNCLYAEMGISFQSGPGTQPNDMLISFSCNQVQARTFAWPHSATGMSGDGVKKIAKIVKKLWPPGS